VGPLELLARVAREGRYLTSESPEQVGNAVGVSGRTVRRIEDPDMERRPRRLTVETLCQYYALDSELLVMLAKSQLEPDALDRLIRERAEAAGLASGGPLPQVALALARAPRDEASLPESEQDFIGSFRRLEPPRRRIAAVLIQQLLLAQAEERRRREGSTSHQT
jgi:hypothetical protein